MPARNVATPFEYPANGNGNGNGNKNNGNTGNAGNYVLSDPGDHYAQILSGTIHEIIGSPGVIDAQPFTFRLSNLQYPLQSGSVTADIDIIDAAAIVTVHDSTGGNLRPGVHVGDYAYLTDLSSHTTPYLITGLVPNEPFQFYIGGYTGGSVAGYSIQIYRRLIDGGIGYFVYQGLTLNTAPDNYESSNLILNAPLYEGNNFTSNFLIVIDGQYYSIGEIDGENITLIGPPPSNGAWPTGGTEVYYSIYQYSRNSFPVYHPEGSPYPAHDFGQFPEPAGQISVPAGPTNWESDKPDRRGKSIISLTSTNTQPSMAFWAWANNAAKNKPEDQVLEFVPQKEAITYSIQWKENDEHK